MAYSGTTIQANDLDARLVMLTNMLDEKTTLASITGNMRANPALVQATGEAKTVKIATATTQGLGNYSEVNGHPLGTASLKWQTYELTHNRSRGFNLDDIDIMQDGGLVSAATLMSNFMTANVVPEIDATRLAGVAARVKTLAGATVDGSEGYVAAAAPTKSNIFSAVKAGLDTILDRYHATSGVTIYVNAAYKNILEMSSEFSRSKDISAPASGLSAAVTSIEGNPVVWAPSAYMYSALYFNDGITTGQEAGGFEAASAALPLVFEMVAPDTAQGVVSYEKSKYIPSANRDGYDADFISYHIYHDLILTDTKAEGCYVYAVSA